MKNLNASKPAGHPTSQRGESSKRLGGNIGCVDKNTSWDMFGFPDAAASCQQYNIGEKPAVILYAYIIAMQVHQNRVQSTLNKNKTQSYVILWLISGSNVGESKLIVLVRFTIIYSRISTMVTLKYRGKSVKQLMWAHTYR